MSKIKHVYLDMDDVLINFTQGCVDLFGKPFDENDVKFCWRKIGSSEGWWKNLPPFDNAHEFIRDLVVLSHEHSFEVHILSGTPSANTAECEMQKMECVKMNIPTIHPSRVHFCKSKSKHMYADPFSILVDDRESNIQNWSNAGGIGMLHNSTTHCLSNVLADIRSLLNG